MTQILAIITELENEGVSIKLVNDELQLSFESDHVDSDLIDKIRANKSELITFLKKYSGQDNYEQITAIQEQECYPLSNAQKRLWTLCQFEEEVAAYNMPNHLKFQDLNVDYFKTAISQVIERHESLRTVFKLDRSEDVKQWIIPTEQFQFEIGVQDFRSLENKDERLSQALKEDAFKPFDLINGPLIRAAIFRLDEQSYVFSFNMHHIISDGWSMDVLMKDVMYFYKAQSNDQMPGLEPLKIQYKDYAHWQINQLEADRFKEHKEYWINSLKGHLPLLDLSADSARPKFKTHRGKRLMTYFSASTSQELKKYCQTKGGSLFMGLMSIWNCLHFRYTGQNDLITGFPVAGRDHNDLENQIGFYVNMLALRLQLNPEASFDAFFETVKSNVLEAFDHQMYPFDRLVEDLNVRRDTSRSVLFDASMTLLNMGENQSESTIDPKYQNEIVELGDVVAKFDIDLTFREVGGQIQFELEFNSDLYEKQFISALMKNFKHLTDAILEQSSTAICDIDMLGESEREKILFEFNATDSYVDSSRTILDEFNDQVHVNGERSAVLYYDKILTFNKLDALSSQFANYLSEKHKVEKGQFVALKLERNEFIPVCILGVLKTGCAYVPIDPEYPQERIAYIEKNSASSVVVDDQMLEDFKESKSGLSTKFESVKIQSEDLAYVIYTSGSTGAPKGVMCTHGNVVSLAKPGSFIGLVPHDILLSTGSPSFDVTTFEYFCPLLNGTAVVFIDKKDLLELDKIEHEIAQKKISVVHFIPALLNRIVDEKITILSNVKTILTGGDKVSATHVNKIRSTYPQINVIQAYGPTENTTFSTTFLVDDFYDKIPIGKPLTNRQVYILDERMNPMPIGVDGEICVGGLGTAKGYLNQPDLTDEKFIDNPFIENKKIYKTGDFGRWLPNGTIQFVGRKDDQVKIRGYRIELGEVEHILSQIAELDKVVVIARNAQNGEQELVAFYTGTLSEGKAKKKAIQKLPSFMIPDYFLSLEELPLTSNDKVDRKALRSYDVSGFNSGDEYVAPSSDLEKGIIAVWSKVLGLSVDKIGLNDDFFMLGGHSLKATKLIGEYSHQFNKKISLRAIFEHPSPFGHAQLLVDLEEVTHQEIPKVSEMDDYPISDAQRRLWVLSQFEEGLVAYNMPSYLELKIENTTFFEKAIDAVIQRHESLRTTFSTNDQGEVRQKILSADQFKLHLDHQDFSQHPKAMDRVFEYVKEDAAQPFDLEKGPLVRAALLKIDPETFVFYFNMHHIISDGWSVDVLSNDVMHCYQTFMTGSQLNNSELKIQYKDYASWQLSQLDSREYENHKKYWKDKLNNELPVLELAGAKRRPKVRSANGNRLTSFIDVDTMNSLRHVCEYNGGTPYIVFLTAWKMLLFRYTGQNDVLIGSPVSGRDHVELHNQIGFYVNTIVLRHAINSEHGFREIFNEVKTSVLEAYEHQSYPFDRLVEELDLPRDPSRNALIDNMVSFQNSTVKIDLSSIDWNEIIDQGPVASKFDLELSITEIGEAAQVDLEYNSDIYTNSVMSQMLRHFKALLNEALKSVEVPLQKLNFLSDSELTRITQQFNANETVDVAHETVWQAFKNVTEIHASDIAVRCKDDEITYAQLDAYSDKAASYLSRQYQITKGDFIGVDLPKSQWTPVVILGILKIGAVYVPIDSDYPKERKEYILNDSNAKFCVDQTTINHFLSIFNEIQHEVHSTSTAEELAYVIYTSGSSGNPKGVMVTNGQLMCKLFEERHLFNLPKVVSYALTNTVFDVSILELVFPLCFGGTVVIPPENSQLDLLLTIKSMLSGNVNVLQGTPTYFKHFVQVLKPEDGIALNEKLKYIAIGGESLTHELVAALKSCLPNVQINNHYGPTETTIDAIVSPNVQHVHTNIIGKPIGASVAYILDEFNNVQPVGVFGELIIGGPSVTSGYLNQTELTQKQFISSPFKADELIYKTGDICRWTEDGEIEFLGRNDSQVKIRGNRIELGEVQKAVNTLNEVIDGVVLARSINDQDKVLVAYVITENELDNEDLKNQLRKHLPEYMVPGFFIPIEEFPLTANGKLDEKALPSIAEGGSNTSDYVAPSNDTESKLAEIYAQILGFGPIGMNDNFFAIGGNSISVIQLNQRLKQEFQVEFNIVELFSKTSIRAVSEMLHELIGNSPEEAAAEELNTMKF